MSLFDFKRHSVSQIEAVLYLTARIPAVEYK